MEIYNKKGEHYSKSILNTRNYTYFDSVSVGLWSSQTWFIISDSIINDIQITLTDDILGGFTFYTVSGNEMVIEDSKVLNLTDNTLNGSTYIYTFNVGFKYDEQVNATVNLNISSISSDISMDIELACDTIVNESRYEVLLQNEGVRFDERFINAFKETNLNEDKADYKILNSKRFRFLLEKFSQKAFIGSYYGLINALKFFGYDDDVIIKEIWKNVYDTINDISKIEYKSVNIESGLVPKNGFTRTNGLQLVYRLNDFDTGFDSDGLPNLVNIFRGRDEAIIKMNNLRLLLERYFMPSKTNIIDIIGEEIVLESFNENVIFHSAMIYYYNEMTTIQHTFEFDGDIKTRNVDHTGIENDTVSVFEPTGTGSNFKDNISTLLYSTDNVSDIQPNVSRIVYKLVDINSPTAILTVFEKEEYFNPYNDGIFDPSTPTGIMSGIELNIRKSGLYKFIVEYYDFTNEITVVHYDIECTQVKMKMNVYNTITGNTDRPVTNAVIYDEFQNGNFVIPDIPTTPQNSMTYSEYRLSLLNNTVTETPIYNEIIEFENTTTNQWNILSNFDDLVKSSLDELNNTITHLKPIKFRDLRTSQYNDFKNDKIFNYLGGYAYIEIDTLGDLNTSGVRTITIANSDDITTLLSNHIEHSRTFDATAYSGLSSSQQIEYRIENCMSFCSVINNNSDGIFGDLTAHVREIETGVFRAVLMSRNISSELLYYVDVTTALGMSVNKFNAVILDDVNAFCSIGISDDGDNSDFTLRLINSDGSIVEERTESNIVINSTTALQTLIDGYTLEGVTTLIVDNMLHIMSTHSLYIDHGGLGGLTTSVPRLKTVPTLKQIDIGDDIRQLSSVFIELDINNSVLNPTNIVWNLYNNTNGIRSLVNTQTNTMFSEVLFDEGVYDIELNYTDNFGGVYKEEYNGIFLVKHINKL